MAVSKRLRFEILRRDNHACRYCGAVAPDVKLTVDHVLPESLGGSDDPTNLVAACAGCNSGKSSIAPDSALVDGVAEDAVRFAQALARAQQERWADRDHMSDLIDEFDEAWLRWKRDSDGAEVPRSPDWETTVARWVSGGLDIEELCSMVPTAMRKGYNDAWRYFCGIGWKMLTALQQRAYELATEAKLETAG